ncbi:MAG TPA: hypothetical protein VF773_22285 [Verrucomicrobiae bacterium]
MTHVLRFIVVSAFWTLLSTAPSRGATPNVEQIIQKLIERSESSDVVNRRNNVSFQRVSRVEYLNEDGTKRRETVRIFKIVPEEGKPVTRLVSVNGRAPKDPSDKNRSAARQTGEQSRALALNEDLLSRFDFSFVREDKFLSRPVWVLAFVPKKGAPEESMIDKFINATTGTFWIDQQDYQLARADVRLGKKVAFFGGIAGAIDKLDLTLIQKRLEESVWIGEAVHIDFAGRKLLKNIRFRAFENCSDFQFGEPQHARAK